MKIEYEVGLLQAILNMHKVEPIDYIQLTEEEYEDVYTEAKELNIINGNKEYWFSINGCSITFNKEWDS